MFPQALGLVSVPGQRWPEKAISEYDFLEGFWALYNHIQLPSNLMPGCEYSLFKDGIKPMWEDEKNKQGG